MSRAWDGPQHAQKAKFLNLQFEDRGKIKLEVTFSGNIVELNFKKARVQILPFASLRVLVVGSALVAGRTDVVLLAVPPFAVHHSEVFFYLFVLLASPHHFFSFLIVDRLISLFLLFGLALRCRSPPCSDHSPIFSWPAIPCPLSLH